MKIYETDDKYLRAACEAAAAGADIAMSYFGPNAKDATVKEKHSTYNLVSIADVNTEKAIVEKLRSHFPDHNFFGEELAQESTDSDSLWIIDPIDGTNNFLHGLPWFGISIGFYKDGKPVCGVVLNPVTEDWYTCVAGKGSWHNGVRVNVSTSDSFEDSIIGVGFYYDRDEKMRATLRAIESIFEHHVRGIRRFGAASLDLCMVGCGAFAAYFEFHLSPWDFAAGKLFVEEAGGKVLSWKGDKIGIESSSVLASNGKMHEKIQKIVQHHFHL
jgi:myo-inositol-1(or 4)-monophosphatase